MEHIPYTCPVIDDVLEELKMHKVVSFSKGGNCYYISSMRMEGIVEKLEELRKLNKKLREQADTWKKLYKYATYNDPEFNPEECK